VESCAGCGIIVGLALIARIEGLVGEGACG
jgi:hypothetical protein